MFFKRIRIKLGFLIRCVAPQYFIQIFSCYLYLGNTAGSPLFFSVCCDVQLWFELVWSLYTWHWAKNNLLYKQEISRSCQRQLMCIHPLIKLLLPFNESWMLPLCSSFFCSLSLIRLWKVSRDWGQSLNDLNFEHQQQHNTKPPRH